MSFFFKFEFLFISFFSIVIINKLISSGDQLDKTIYIYIYVFSGSPPSMIHL